MSLPISNVAVVTEAPSETLDDTCRKPEMPLIEFSIGRVICSSTSEGAAPFCVTVTMTIGNSTFGNCLTGSII